MLTMVTPQGLFCLHFTQALEELMFRNPQNPSFGKCRELVAAILYAKLRGIPLEDLKNVTLSFSHSDKTAGLESMTDLQRQTVQAFMTTVYDVHNYFSPRAIRSVSCFNMRITESMHLNRMRFLVGDGTKLMQLCKESCKCDMDTLSDMYNDKPLEVLSRDSLPTRWRSVITYITIFLQHTMSSSPPL